MYREPSCRVLYFFSAAAIKDVEQKCKKVFGYIGLRTRILGLKKHLCNEEVAGLIEATCRSNRLIPPTEGMLPEIIIDRILKAIQSIGYDC